MYYFFINVTILSKFSNFSSKFVNFFKSKFDFFVKFLQNFVEIFHFLFIYQFLSNLPLIIQFSRNLEIFVCKLLFFAKFWILCQIFIDFCPKFNSFCQFFNRKFKYFVRICNFLFNFDIFLYPNFWHYCPDLSHLSKLISFIQIYLILSHFISFYPILSRLSKLISFIQIYLILSKYI